MQKKIMILTASTGGGHNKASRAIQDELNKLNIDSEIVDCFKDIGTVGKALDIMVSGGYEKSARYVPKVYGKAYEVADKKIVRKTFDYNFITKYMEINILKKIESDNITHIIGTHPFPIIAVSKLKNKGKINLPIYSVITDYTIHLAHIAAEIDKYIVAHEDTKLMLENDGVKSEHIYPLGIPISMKEYSDEDIISFKRENEIDDKFTVLVVGGSFGAGDIKSVYKELLQIPNINILIICGRNKSLKEKLEYSTKNNDNVKIIGFTKEIEKYYQASDVIVTKPGGLTVTECMQKKLPMIIPFFIPGQEEGNKDFVVNNQIGVNTTRYYSVSLLVKTLMNDKVKLTLMKNAMEKNRKMDSASNIAKLFL